MTTFFFLGPFSISFLFGMMMMYYTLSQVEAHFDKKQAELATLLAFNAVFGILIASLAGESAVMQNPMLFSLIYVWSRLVPDQQMSIWGFPIMSVNLPWALMAMHLFTGGNPFNDLIGVAIGHTYIFLKQILPESHGYDLLKTPGFMESLVMKLNTMGQNGQARQDPMYVMNNPNNGQGNVEAARRQDGGLLNRNGGAYQRGNQQNN